MSTYTPSLGLELITPGSQAGLWGNTTNNTFNLIDQAITGVTPLSFASASGTTQTLTDFNGAEDQARAAVLNITGTASGPNTVVIPNKQKTYMVRNGTGQDITFQTPAATTPNIVAAGNNTLIFCDGNNGVFPGILVPGAGTLGVNGGGTGVTTFSAGFIKSPGGTTSLTSSPTVSLTTEVAGTLAVANGGTGKSSLTSGALLFGNGTGAVGEFVGGAAGQVATWNGSGWAAVSPTTGGVSSVAAGTGITVTGTATNPIVNNGGVLSVGAGTGISIGGTTANPIINVSGAGTVTSVGLSSGTTGLTVTPSGTNPITTSGTFTLGGTLAVASGGTGATTASGAATNLGFVPKTGGAYTGDVTSTTLFRAPSLSAGATTTTAVNISTSAGGSSINWYAPLVGNQWTSLYFAATATALGNQDYVMTFNNGLNTQYSGYQFNGAGNATAIHGSWVDTSDIRIKENITPVTSGLDKLTQLNPVMFSYKKDALTTPNKYGLIAQELELVIPEVVAKNEGLIEGIDELRSVAYTNLIPVLIKAIQELKAEIDTLKAAK